MLLQMIEQMKVKKKKKQTNEQKQRKKAKKGAHREQPNHHKEQIDRPEERLVVVFGTVWEHGLALAHPRAEQDEPEDCELSAQARGLI